MANESSGRKAVVIDFFGTLTPSTPNEVWSAHAAITAAALGVSAEDWGSLMAARSFWSVRRSRWRADRLVRMPSHEEITRHHEPVPDEDPWVLGPPKPGVVEIVAYDQRWPDRFATLDRDIRAALDVVAIDVEHVGSTSVPGLGAKDVIDIDLTVADPTDERSYVPSLERLGYVLVIREPSFHEHRCLTLKDPSVNLHVFGPDCPETIRHRMFRDWLRSHPEDRELYEQAKRRAVPGGGHVMDYNRRKQDVLQEIYDRMFRAAGMK